MVPPIGAPATARLEVNGYTNTMNSSAAISPEVETDTNNTTSVNLEQIETTEQPKIDLPTKATATTSPEAETEKKPMDPFEECRQVILEGEKSQRDFLDLWKGEFGLVVSIAKRFEEEGGSTAQRQQYQDIADTMMLTGEPVVTDRTKEMLEENVLFQAMRLHMVPTIKALGDFWDGVDKAKETWGQWNWHQLECTIRAVEEGKFDIKTLDEIKERVRIMIDDQKDLRPRYIANIDHWIEVSDKQYKFLSHDWTNLIHPIGLQLEPAKMDEWIWREFQKTVTKEPGRVTEIVENIFIYLYTHRLTPYLVWSKGAIDSAKKFPGFQKYSAKKKEDKDLTLLGALPEYKSLENPPMDIEAVEANWHYKTYPNLYTVGGEMPIEWIEGQPGRSFKTIFRAFNSIRGNIRVFANAKDDADGYIEFKNDDIEYELRATLKLLEAHPGFSQLPTLEFLKLLNRACIEGGVPLAGDRREFVDRMDPKAGPITVRDLDNFIAKWKENQPKTQEELDEITNRVNVRLRAEAEAIAIEKARLEQENAGDGKEENVHGQESTSGDNKQGDIEDHEDTFVDAQEDVPEAEGTLADAE